MAETFFWLKQNGYIKTLSGRGDEGSIEQYINKFVMNSTLIQVEVYNIFLPYWEPET